MQFQRNLILIVNIEKKYKILYKHIKYIDLLSCLGNIYLISTKNIHDFILNNKNTKLNGLLNRSEGNLNSLYRFYAMISG